MGAKAMQKNPAQWVAINRVTADLEGVQSRAAMSKEDEREFCEAMRDGGWGTFPPLVIFFDGKKYWLADGFHRYFAAKKAGLDAVYAEVREGTKRDAVIHSAGANIKFSIRRTAEDKKRAVMLLLDDPVCFTWTLEQIGRHCGVLEQTAAKYRAEYCVSHNVKIPSRQRSPSYTVDTSGGRPRARTTVNGKRVWLGNDGPRARERYARLLEDSQPAARVQRTDSCHGVSLDRTHRITSHLVSLGFFFQGESFGKTIRSFGISGLIGHGITLCWINPRTPDSLPKAIGSVAILSRAKGSGNRKVILYHPTESLIEIIELAKTIDGGIEFMTPEEFVADLKARGH